LIYYYFNFVSDTLQRKWQVKLQEGVIEFAKSGEEKTFIPKKELIAANLGLAVL